MAERQGRSCYRRLLPLSVLAEHGDVSTVEQPKGAAVRAHWLDVAIVVLTVPLLTVTAIVVARAAENALSAGEFPTL
jgi:hypothetical protein